MTVVAVIGLGYVGLPLAVEFGKKFRTIGFDLSAPKIDSYRKGIDPTGLVFFTNYGSRKATDIGENPNAAIHFFWRELERQVEINGLEYPNIDKPQPIPGKEPKTWEIRAKAVPLAQSKNKLRFAVSNEDGPSLEEKVIPLEQAIRSASGLPADILQLPQRGYLKVGYFADLVVFDPKTFRDKATYDEPHQYSTGVEYVLVNGKPVLERGRHTHARPGAIVYGQGKT